MKTAVILNPLVLLQLLASVVMLLRNPDAVAPRVRTAAATDLEKWQKRLERSIDLDVLAGSEEYAN